jgi:hypothetical protein
MTQSVPLGPDNDVRFTPEADICSANRHVRYGPIAEIGSITIVHEACCGSRQNYPDFGELAWLRFDLD